AFSVEQQALGERVCLDLQVRAPARRVEIAHRGAHPTTAADRRLRHADAVLLPTVVVLGVGDAKAAPRQSLTGFVPEIRFAPDSPVEGDGFELSVPGRAIRPFSRGEDVFQ